MTFVTARRRGRLQRSEKSALQSQHCVWPLSVELVVNLRLMSEPEESSPPPPPFFFSFLFFFFLLLFFFFLFCLFLFCCCCFAAVDVCRCKAASCFDSCKRGDCRNKGFRLQPVDCVTVIECQWQCFADKTAAPLHCLFLLCRCKRKIILCPMEKINVRRTLKKKGRTATVVSGLNLESRTIGHNYESLSMYNTFEDVRLTSNMWDTSSFCTSRRTIQLYYFNSE